MMIASLQRMQHVHTRTLQAFRLCDFQSFIAKASTRGRREAFSIPARQAEHQTVKQSQPLYRTRKCLCTASRGPAAGCRQLFLYSKEDCPLCDGYKVALLDVFYSSLGSWSVSRSCLQQVHSVPQCIYDAAGEGPGPSEQGAVHGHTAYRGDS